MLTAAFIQDIRNAFALCRDGHILELSTIPLATSTLIDACLLSDDPLTPDLRGRAVEAVLHWAVERLRPDGDPNWMAYHWRTYNILFHFYLRRMRASELAARMAVVEQTIYDSRSAAFVEVARVLHEELIHPQDATGRKHTAITARYTRLLPHERLLLRCAAIFRHPVPSAVVVQLVQETTQSASLPSPDRAPTSLPSLIASRLVVSDDERITVLAHPEVRPYLLALLSPQERQVWHTAAGQYYQARQQYLEAAIQYRLAGRVQSAADLLVMHQRTILDDLHMEELWELLGDFRPGEVTAASWFQLKLISGEIAEAMQDVDTAISEYAKALGAPEASVKALAYYRRGKVLKQKNPDEALVHYQQCIRVLTAAGASSALMARAYIGQAWVFFEDRHALAEAELALQQAQHLVETTELELLAELHNAWGEFHFHVGDLARARDAHLECHRIATELQHVDLILKSLHNLGMIYVEQHQYQQGLDYLLACQALAARTGHRRLDGLSNNSIGACYFWLQAYEQAIVYYQRARTMFIDMGNRNWQAGVCYDLAEAYAQLEDWTEASAAFQEGLALIAELNLERHRHSFSELAQRYPALARGTLDISARQRDILAFIERQGAIKSGDCARLLGLSKEQAIRDLNDMVAKNILVRSGVARATHYALAESYQELGDDA